MKSIRNFVKILGAALITGAALTCFAGAAELKDIDNHWAKEYIEYGVEKGYINGYEDGTFRPNGSVTRAEFSKMINSATKISATKNITFSDVESKSWFYNDIRKAVYAGYVGGYEDGTFRPNNLISRQEAAVILYRISVPTDKRANLNEFGDGDVIASWAKDAVSAVVAKGYISGDENKNFTPTQHLTRAQAAKLICEFVDNENVINGDFTIEARTGKTFAEAIFTDNVICADDVADTEIFFEGCRILGSLIIDGKNVNVLANGSEFGSVILENEGAELNLDASGAKVINVLYPATISGNDVATVNLNGDELYLGTIHLDGDFDTVNVSKSAIIKASGKINNLNVVGSGNLIIQSGDIENLNVDTAAKNSIITLSKNTSVENAKVNAAVSFEGQGVITNAANGVSGITYETRPVNVTGKDSGENGKEDENALKSPTVTPTNGKTNVSTYSVVKLTFADTVYDKNGNKISVDYVEDNVKLRRASKTGSVVSCTVSVTSGNSTITLAPKSELIENTKYYVVFDEDVFYDKDGKSNVEFSSYFTTEAEEEQEITFSPKNTATDVELDSPIKITFSSAIKRANGSAVSNAYLESGVIELREKSSTGTLVDFSATISSSRIITITPEEPLEPDTKYYVIITANSFVDGNGDKITKKTSYFTTDNSLVPKITPTNASTGISTAPEITIEFTQALKRSNGSALTPAYIVASVVELKKTSATSKYDIDFTATVSADKKTITITPDEVLEKNTKYYVVINAETLKSTSGAVNEKITSYFTTAANMTPVVTPANKETGVPADAQITVKYEDALYDSSSTTKRKLITAEYIEDNDVVVLRYKSTTGKIIPCDVTVSSDSKTITLTPTTELVTDVKYYVVVKGNSLYNESRKVSPASTTYFSTTQVLTPEITPIHDEEDVELDIKPEIVFDEAVYMPGSDGEDTLTKTYLVNEAIKLFLGDENGTEVDFTAAIDKANQIITVTPTDDLEGGSEYTLVVLSGAVENKDGVKNPKTVSTFTTKASTSTTATITPANNSKDISLYTDITVKFPNKIYTSNAKTVDEDYVSQYITLKQGTKVVDVDVTISSDGKLITLTPFNTLEAGKKYTVSITGSKFQYANDTKVKAQTSYFTTGTGAPTLSKFETVKVGAASAEFSVLSDTDGVLYITATPTRGTAVTKEFNVVAGISKNVVMTGLAPKTTYSLKAYVVSDADISSKNVTSDIKTQNAFNMELLSFTDCAVEVNAIAYAAGELTITYKNVETGEVETSISGAIMAEGKERAFTVANLLPETQYEIIAEFICDGNETDVVKITLDVTTAEAVDYLAIESVVIEDANANQYNAEINGQDITVHIEATESVKVKVSVPGASTTIKINGRTVEKDKFSSAIEVTGETLVVPISVTYEGETLDYTLTINAN